MKQLALCALLTLAACSPAAQEESANTVEPAAAEQQAVPAEVPSLEGQWRVTGIRGEPPRQYYPMTTNVTADRFTIESDCVRMAWGYTQERNVVKFTPAAAEGCQRAPTPAEEQVERVVELANIAMFSEEGREVSLTGPGGKLTMERR